MGGLAFTSGSNPLFTPRMPPGVYRHILRYCQTKLRELFVVVATPIPAPAKKDYGDIDIFLTWERAAVFPSPSIVNHIRSISPSTNDPLQVAARILNTHRYIEQRKTLTSAISWPDNLHQEIDDSDAETSNSTREPRYIQVDLHLCDSLEHLQWELFKTAHGDLWNLVGNIIRPYGLTIDGVGLFIRVPEIEDQDKPQSKILLSTEPTVILEFLGLKYDGTQWEEPFESEDDLFQYVSTCRLFTVRPGEDDKMDEAKLRANDRRRLKHRHVFRRWQEEFLPACRREGRFTTHTLTRESVRDEAFATFPGSQCVYDARLNAWYKEQQRRKIWRGVIKASIPEFEEGKEAKLGDQEWRGHAAGALRRIVMYENYDLGIRPALPMRDEEGFYIEENIRRFVREKWEEVGDAICEENKRQFEKWLAEKARQGESGAVEGKVGGGAENSEEGESGAEKSPED